MHELCNEIQYHIFICAVIKYCTDVKIVRTNNKTPKPHKIIKLLKKVPSALQYFKLYNRYTVFKFYGTHRVRAVPLSQAQYHAIYCLVLRWSRVVKTEKLQLHTSRNLPVLLKLSHHKHKHTRCWPINTINKKLTKCCLLLIPFQKQILWYNNIKKFLTCTKVSIFMQYIMRMPPTLKTDAVCSLQTSANAYQTKMFHTHKLITCLKRKHTFYVTRGQYFPFV
jgi:hypothetical protein